MSVAAWGEVWGLAPPTTATTRLFAKVIAGRSTSRSVPGALFRLHCAVPAAVFSYILQKKIVPGTTECSSILAHMRSLMTHKTMAMCIFAYACTALRHRRALCRALGMSRAMLAQSESTANHIRQAVGGCTLPCARPINIVPPDTTRFALAATNQSIWKALESAVGVKTRIPAWVIGAIPDARHVYQLCIKHPMQFTEAFARSIGLWHPTWTVLFDHGGARRGVVAELPVAVRAALYLLVHAHRTRGALFLTTRQSAATASATVCGSCVSMRSKPRSATGAFKRACSGVRLDLRLQRATCTDCGSDALHQVSLASRQIAVATPTGPVCMTGCGVCGNLVAVNPRVRTKAACGRCRTPLPILPCFCRASPKATVGTFLCSTSVGLLVSGVCRRHHVCVPASVEPLAAVARRAGVRI